MKLRPSRVSAAVGHSFVPKCSFGIYVCTPHSRPWEDPTGSRSRDHKELVNSYLVPCICTEGTGIKGMRWCICLQKTSRSREAFPEEVTFQEALEHEQHLNGQRKCTLAHNLFMRQLKVVCVAYAGIRKTWSRNIRNLEEWLRLEILKFWLFTNSCLEVRWPL